MQVQLLGPVAIIGDDGNTVAIGGPRLRTLLALLALRVGEVVPTERLIDGIWGERPPADAGNALQTLIKRLRAAIGADRVVRRMPGYLLALEPDAVDTFRFTRMLAEGARLRTAGDAWAAAAAFDDALAPWRGRAAIAGVVESAEIAAATAILADQRLTAIESRADAYLALGRGSEVLRELFEEAAAHPVREPLAARLIGVLTAAGRKTEALQAFQRIEDALRAELGVEPSALLRQSIVGLVELPSASARRETTAPPRRLTSFVGRGADVDEVASMLRRGRLVTLIGAGGVGKTRLATELLRAHGSEWPDGYLFVEAAAVAPERPGSSRYTALGAALLAAAGVVEGDQPGEDWIPGLVRALWARRMLLIIDNCEHVLRAAAETIEQLLQRLPLLTLLTTSREPLGAAEERRYVVRPLGLPGDTDTAEHAVDSAAVRLFIDRATSVRPDFAVTEENYPDVRAIVRRLDGLPLAIELAAARLQGLPLCEVATRLDDRFRLLTNGTRLAAARHRSLHAAVAWSWDLLSEPEGELARRMAIFAGGATPEHLMRVCGDGFEVPRSDIAEAAKSLAAKSLIEFDGERYRMVETIRAYAAAEAQRTGEAERSARAHADCFVEFAETGAPGLRGTTQREWLRRFAAEQGNCRAALQWAVDNADRERSVCLFGNLFWYWHSSGQWGEIRTWQPAVLAVVGDSAPPGCTGPYLVCRYGRYVPPYVSLFWVVEIPHDTGEFERSVRAATTEGRAPHPMFVLILARREYERGRPRLLTDCATADDAWLRGHALQMRAVEEIDFDSLPRALADLEAAVGCLGESADPGALVRALLILAHVRVRYFGIGSAAPLLARATGELIADFSPNDRVVAMCVAAWLHLVGSDIGGAATYLACAEEHDDGRLIEKALRPLRANQARLASRQGRHQRAIELFGRLFGGPDAPRAPLPGRRGLGPLVEEIYCRVDFAIALSDAGRLNSARWQLEIARELGAAASPIIVPDIAVGYAHAAIATGDVERAARILGAVVRQYRRMGRRVLGPDVERVMARVRANLPEARCTELADEGAAMDLGELLADTGAEASVA
ncbi:MULTISPECIES: BTAD domain-containing putative transcriptional regulator [unclassified Nocardia]|uniref:BTAD domain-containing putative transcriptional regulator n=1 Tax=unclassified Nocardia TaxID=2637762 RepID=UPI001CE4A0ED|nr:MULTISPECIES: BTAD domain-containing putative transcriptional regulator [unclassified Nocardia]